MFLQRIRAIKNYKGKGNSLLYYLKWRKRGMLDKLTFRKAFNIICTVFDWMMGKVVLKSKPFIVRLEPSAICNLQCPPCMTPKRVFLDGQITQMSLEAFNVIFSSISQHAYLVTFYLVGEPMTHPKLFQMVKIANRQKTYTSFCTNFTLMKKELIEPLFDSGLDWMSVCLDGFSQEVYEKYRVNGNVERVIDGIKMVTAYKKDHGCKRPFLNVYTIVFNHVKPEIDQIKQFCTKHDVDRLTFRPDESGWDRSFSNITPKNTYNHCFWPWLTLTINVDGSVFPCDWSFHRRYHNIQPYGNLTKQSLDKIWNNNLYVETRKYLSGQSKKKEDLDIPCYQCTKYGNVDQVRESHSNK